MQQNLKQHSNAFRVGLIVMGLFYLLAGVNHFAHPATYVAVMPPYLPWPLMLVYVSGLAEILGGLGVLVPNGFIFPGIRRFAAWGIVLMLAVFLLVHTNMALHPDAFPHIPVWIIWARIPLQFPLMYWAWWYTRK